MKAIVHHKYGSPNVLKLEEIEKPVPADDEVLVRVYTASLNILDWYGISGLGIARVGGGFRQPKDPRVGVDFAGVIETVGANVKQFRPGDEVYGGRGGSFAEYVTVREQRGIASKPADMTFEQAATIPVAGLTALQGLRDKGQVRPGQKVLINGASGGVGTFAVQIAKAFGSDRRVPHTARRPDPFTRRRPCVRLRPGGLHPQRTALRPRARRDGWPIVAGFPARSEAECDLRPHRRPEDQSFNRTVGSHPQNPPGCPARQPENPILHRERE